MLCLSLNSSDRAAGMHGIVVDQGSLRWQIASYLEYYQRSRSHLSLGKGTPDMLMLCSYGKERQAA